ncbi:pyridine nucleotide-disulfide oxidoreductase family protein [Purpureocillium lavendulum]|uniref:Pyridine nucleotide-disulfide oxidoreductase family protein n=1 Tax=Purpureocillium lavendulum TaxID=1247861 RepID=A0AB34FZY9_9HYPO|nr:pyridine nucleotide-disulfide oxidoreductase family protein [Purpureocillium lavendulum]
MQKLTMRNSVIAAALLAGAADLAVAAPGTGCNADNCLRALRATQIPGRLESARAFCATYTAAPSPTAVPVPSYAADACKKNQNADQPARLSSACSCIAPATTTTTQPTASACAEVSASWASQIKSTPVPTVAASLAHECLNSVPLGKDAALKLVDALEPYLEWQSDAGYKKDPPKDYFYPGFDLFGNLAKVKANIQADKYKSEYAFQTDLYETVYGPGHDGHYVFYPDALAKAFKWRRQRSLVSISEDGKSLPVIKLYGSAEDVVKDPKTARAVTKINGIEASKYVEETINKATYNQDVDSAYNSMFYSKAFSASAGLTGYFNNGGRIGVIYQGPNTTFTFADGEVVSLENKANIIGNMDGVVDGASFYKKFCTPAPAAKAAQKAPAGPKQLPGYPKPVISTSDGVVSGYYLTGEGLENVAVIVLTAFESASPAEFQAVTQDFFHEAKAAGKTKLVVDFQVNGGGYILLGYDFFRQLFPNIQEDGYSRWKENGGFNAMSRIFSDAVKDLDPANSADSELIGLYESWFNYRYDLNLTLDKFATFDDKFAPQVFKDTPYTSLMRWDLNDPLTTVNATFGMGIEISGYGTRKNLTQPFKAEDIILLYDGVCASTCTLASEMLRIQGGVKSVAFGGRPKEGPIQGVGGVKGSQVLQYADIYSYAAQAVKRTKDPKQLADLQRYTDLPLKRSTAAAVNVRDQILRDNVNDGLPAQFVAEEADCRLYWTAPMISDVTEIWKAAANAAFNGVKCAYGGIKASKRSATVLAPPVIVPRARLSAAVDTTPVEHSEEWLAMHQQKAIE